MTDQVPPEIDHLIMVTIYKSPADHPGKLVARAFKVTQGGVSATTDPPLVMPDSEGALAAMRRQMGRLGMTNLGRQANDEAQIVETWA